MSDRNTKMKEVFNALFKCDPNYSQSKDPELMEILQKFIFGDIFSAGELTNKERELITVVSIATLQCLPQLKAHINAALNVGNSPLEIREALYTLCPFIGFPRTLNSLEVFNTVMTERKINLPLENGKLIKDEERYEKGKEIMQKNYSDALEKMLKDVPGGIGNKTSKFLTEIYSGDIETRKFLDIKTKELIYVICLVALNSTSILKPHLAGAVKSGNSYEKVAAALLQTAPYVGFATPVTAMIMLKELKEGH